jgi:hypothetical protein
MHHGREETDMTATSTFTSRTPLAVESAALETVEFDMYNNIHKGLRAELFAVTTAAGSVDPTDDVVVEQTTARLRNLIWLLISHAEHEDEFVQPVLEQKLPDLAAVIAVEHPRLECQLASLEVLSDRFVSATPAERRRFGHQLYLGLASFTAEYLQHQAFEEMEINPALAAIMGPEELLAIDQAIVASIPPEDLGRGLSVMLPAMNIEDRTELLGGIQAGAPAEVFGGVWGLAESVLQPRDRDALAVRLAVA